MDVGLLCLLGRDAWQPAAWADMGQQLHSRPRTEGRAGQVDLRRNDDQDERSGGPKRRDGPLDRWQAGEPVEQGLPPRKVDIRQVRAW